ncbi:N-acetylneuraminate synthase [Allopseudospirillum japonicum]|uniref:N-acetylneuraminate synthase n=1 Tax=Allopseudospirillum japonicum TaxID=64971 RepID=A0A1H6R869_9GAMM|nr:N-acetylneuraminate synthase family protein [Allopseudospirillum japonicum]SEI50666.1 N-acetylneuraminate synthase [Allopseudospirillum japonicum]
MIIEKDLAKYSLVKDAPLVEALEKINKNQSRILFIVDKNGVLEAILTDGDFRRWVIQQEKIDINTPVIFAANTSFVSELIGAPTEKVSLLFSEKVELVPLVNSQGILTAIARNKGNSDIVIENFSIGKNQPVFIISEIGLNHNGSVELAKKLVDLSVESGANCAKFQMRNLSSLYKNKDLADDPSADRGAQYTLEILERSQLKNEQMLEIFDYCKSKGILPLCTPWDLSSLDVLENYGMPAYKVASADMTNHELLRAIAKTGKPIICSTGMANEEEILQSVSLLKNLGASFVLLHCNSTYPAPFKDINLNYLTRLSQITKVPVGYSGHERGSSVALAAVALGACIIEKHFTIDRNMEGNDHKVSLLPHEFKSMVEEIRNIEQALGSNSPRVLTQGEMMNREVLAKSLIINRALAKGEKITRDMIDIKSPGQGLQPCYIDEIVGCTAKRDFQAGDFFFMSDLQDDVVQVRPYKFKRPCGIPVRHHDYERLAKLTNLDFVEFHLSYRDMDLDINNFVDGVQNIGLAVHSPELFANDHIMDMCAQEDSYRQHSIKELKRVIEVTRTMKTLFPKTKHPVIVTNVGGHTKNGFLDKKDRALLYSKIAESLASVDQEGVEVIIQTMPPFPWYFGGQWYQNIFVDADEIKEFCEKYGYRICFDISHSQLACNYYKWDFREFTKKVAPFAAHLHIVDADGVDGEGVQIGTGNVNFAALAEDLNMYAPNVQFIPEIWQGHKNNGEGFWVALDYLEKYF